MPATQMKRRLLFQAAVIAGAFIAVPACARSGPDSFAPLVRQVMPSVVNIAITETVSQGNDPLAALPPELQRQFRDRLSRKRQQVIGAGSGFIIDPEGIIVTNTHVVGKADKIVVSLPDGTALPAKVIGTDDVTDVAVIRVSADHPLPAVGWGDSRVLEVGDWVLAGGNPFGLGGSVTAGIVSARGRDIQTSAFDDFIQIDAPINPGNSGGPLFNMDGQVVGVNAAILSPTGSSVGIGFAIPSEIASRIVSELLQKGRIDRGWLGVSLEETTGKGAHGVAIAAVERAGPGAKAGLRPGDVVTAVNGESVDTSRSLIRAVAATPPGSALHVTIRRQGREMDISVTVGRRPNNEQG
jgi:serine protease Do